MRIIETQIDVAASASSLWQILTDFPAYSDWNPFPGRTAITLKPTILAVAREWELRWRSRRIVPGFFDNEHRFQIRTHGQFCRFHQSERFTGIMVTTVGDDLFDAMQQGFEEMNVALKLRAEGVTNSLIS